MTDIRRLPVLSLSDVVVLPGMVVPIELDEPAQAALDAGTGGEQLELLRELGTLRLGLEAARGGVSLSVPEQEVVAAGEIITYTLKFTNGQSFVQNNVVVTDTLPKNTIYNQAATEKLAASKGVPAPASATVNPDGTTTLVWNLGTRTPNQDLPVLVAVTDTDPLAPNTYDNAIVGGTLGLLTTARSRPRTTSSWCCRATSRSSTADSRST